jgi:PAS domain S-box-containing protein/diguanylate cyclase (GGDEF)-like protein
VGLGGAVNAGGPAAHEWHDERELLRRSLELARAGTYTIDLERRSIWMSPQMAAIFGAGDESLEMPLYEYRRRFYHPDDREASVTKAEEVYRHPGSGLWLTSRVVRADDGAVIWVRARSSPEERPGGKRYVLGVVQDVTQQMLAAQRDRLLATLVASSEDAMLTTDLEGRITYWNPGAARLYGYEAEEVLGRHVSVLTGSESEPELEERLSRLANGEDIQHLLLHRRRKDGTHFTVSATASPLRDDDGRVIGAVLVGRDVTELEAAQAKVRASEQRFRALVQHASDLIGVLDARGVIRYISPSLRSITGRTPAEVIGRHVTDFAHPDDVEELAAYLHLLLRTPGERVDITYRVLHEDGGVRYLEAVTTNLLQLPEVRGMVFNARDVTEAVEYRDQLAQSVLHDPLTGLANRALVIDRVEQGLSRVGGGRGGLFLIDLDHFQAVNDAFGYGVGDEVLVELAKRLQLLAEPGDTVARLGGDRFALWLDGTDEPSARDVAATIIRATARPFPAGAHQVSITATVGVALHRGGDTAEKLLQEANLATLQAKERERGGFEVFNTTMSPPKKSRLELRSELVRALEDEQFVLHYQPEVSLADGQCVGAEALIRWLHPERGLVPPMEFIAAAEESDLIFLIGRWVLETACRDAATWPANDALPFVSVNLSARQFADPDLHGCIAHALESSGLAADRLCLEVTETLLMTDVERTAKLLEAVKGLGVLTAVDDFGTGYSSLAYLTQLPVDFLKIDRVFVEGLNHASDRRGTVVAAVIALADRLGIKTIAEGVETEMQAASLRELGCTVAQGFLYGRPAPHAEIARRMASISRDC